MLESEDSLQAVWCYTDVQVQLRPCSCQICLLFKFCLPSCTGPQLPTWPLHGKRMSAFGSYLWPPQLGRASKQPQLASSQQMQGLAAVGRQMTSWQVELPASCRRGTCSTWWWARHGWTPSAWLCSARLGLKYTYSFMMLQVRLLAG